MFNKPILKNLKPDSNLFKEAGFIKQIGHIDNIKNSILLTEFNKNGLKTHQLNATLSDFVATVRDDTTISWLNIKNIGNLETLNLLANELGIHHLVLEDIQNNDTYSKMEDHSSYIFFTLRMFYVDDNELIPHKISIILGADYVITFQQNYDCFESMNQRFANKNSRIFSMGSDYLAYSLIDIVIDSFYPLVEYISNYNDEINYKLLNHFKESIFINIMHSLKYLADLRKEINPILAITSHLKNYESELINTNMEIYLRDLYDHASQNIESINYQHDNTSSLIQMFHAQSNSKANNIFKNLTIISTIFIPLNFVVGFFGMNFKTIPFLDSPLGFHFILVLLLAITSITIYLLKQRKWL